MAMIICDIEKDLNGCSTSAHHQRLTGLAMKGFSGEIRCRNENHKLLVKPLCPSPAGRGRGGASLEMDAITIS